MAVHNQAARHTDTDWVKIAALVARLERLSPTLMVASARAVAVGMAHGPVRRVGAADHLPDDPLTPATRTSRPGPPDRTSRRGSLGGRASRRPPGSPRMVEQRYLRGAVPSGPHVKRHRFGSFVEDSSSNA